MQYKFIKHVIGILLIILCTQLYAKKHLRDNDILLTNSGGSSISFVSFDFLKKDFYASKGQPTGAVYVGLDAPNTYYLRVESGRHQTSDIANKFKQMVGGKSHSLFGHYPKKLNFIVSGTLEMKIKKDNFSKNMYIKDFVIGQGHNYSKVTNNWWIGGVNCTASKKKSHNKTYMTCTLSSDPIYKICIGRLVAGNLFDLSTLTFSFGECE